MTSNVDSSDSQSFNKPRSITIVNWPLRYQWASSLAIVVFVVGFGYWIGYHLASVPAGVGSILAMLAVSWRNWIPVKFEIGPLGVQQSFLRFSKRIAWHQVKRCEVRGKSIFLLPDHQKTPLAAVKGLQIACGSQVDDAGALVKSYLQRRTTGGSSIRRREKTK